MFPGNSGQSYGYQQQYAPPQGPPGQYGYAPPPGPPGQYEYAPPQGPPGQYQQSYGSNTVGGITYQNPNTPPPMPSQGMQSYGYNGQTVQNYQYSQCNGIKKALVIGINYFGSRNELRGCINDAHNMYNYLLSVGYPADNIVLLSDDQTNNYRSIPTRENIIRAMQWLVSGASPGDSLFFHYSGHGGQEDDQDGDEADGYDDCIYPVDFQQSGSLIDDVMHDVMVRPLPQGCRLTAIFDSCHSGTALDLPFTYRAQDGGLKEYSVWKESGSDALSIAMGYATGNYSNMMSGAKSIFKRMKANTGGNSEAVKQQKMSPADVIMFSGCKDDQTSADAQEAGRFTGALSWAFIQVVSQNPVQSYLTLLQNIRAVLATKYTQKPQMSSSHQIDPNLRFII